MERHNWASEIRMLLCKFGFESVWLEQCVPHKSSFIDNFREKLKEHYIERWQMQLKNSSKLAMGHSTSSQPVVLTTPSQILIKI